MNKDYFVELFRYNQWANQKVWNCALELPQDIYLKIHEFSVGSVYMQLLHTLNIERFWVGFLATGESKLIGQDEHLHYQSRKKFRQLWDETYTTNMIYIESLTDAKLQRQVTAPWWSAEDSITVTQVLTHVINHSTDHRAQTMALLHMLGYDGIEQDFIQYLGHS